MGARDSVGRWAFLLLLAVGVAGEAQATEAVTAKGPADAPVTIVEFSDYQ